MQAPRRHTRRAAYSELRKLRGYAMTSARIQLAQFLGVHNGVNLRRLRRFQVAVREAQELADPDDIADSETEDD